MGKFNQMTIIENVQLQSEFVPSNVMLGGVPTSIVWRSRLGPVKIVQAGFKDATKSALVIVLEDGSRYTCLAATFGTQSMPFDLVTAVKDVMASDQAVELCVAVNPRSGQAAAGYFCGLRLAGSKTDTDLISL